MALSRLKKKNALEDRQEDLVMRTRYAFRQFGLVIGIMCVVLVASSELAAAQHRNSDFTRILMSPNAAGASRIGLSIEDVTEDDAADEGAAVRDVRPDSPAESAGFVEGDVVVEFDGERVRSARQLTRLVQETPAGRTVGTAVMRDGRRVELDVTPESGAAIMAALPSLEIFGERLGNVYSRIAPDVGRSFNFGVWTRPGTARLGVTVQELSPQLADYFGVDDGVLVTGVDEESAAAEAGLQAGDVITSVDGRSVDDINNLRRRLSVVDPGEEVSIGVTRSGRELDLTATTSEDNARRPRLEIFGSDGRSI